MKKIVAVLCLALCAVAVFAQGAQEEATKAKEKTVINLWSGDRHDEVYVNEKIAQFNATHDDIEIKQTIVSNDYFNMIVMAYSSGNAPDIFTSTANVKSFDFQGFVQSGMLLPYPENMINDAHFRELTNIPKTVIEGINAVDGKPYIIYAGQRSGTRMIYNVDLLKASGYTEFPKTLTELVDLTVKVAKDGKGSYYGISTCASAQFERWLEGIINKSGIYHYDFKNGKFNFDGYKEPILIAQRFFKEGAMFPGSNTQGVDAMRAQFANGTFAVWGNASQEAGVFTDQFPIKDFEWAVAELPSLDGSTKGTVDSRPQKGLFMFSSSKNKDAAWEVVKYLNSEAVVKGYVEMGYALPLSEYIMGVVDTSQMGRLADFAPVSYEGLYPSVPAVSYAGDDYAKTIWNCIVNGTDVDKCIADLNKRYNEALEKDVKLGKVKRVVIENFDNLHPNANPISYLSK
mgnify:CR=1 FL=1